MSVAGTLVEQHLQFCGKFFSQETAVEAAELLVEAGTVAYVTRACSDDDHLKHREDSRQRQSFLLPGYKYYHVSTFYNSGRS